MIGVMQTLSVVLALSLTTFACGSEEHGGGGTAPAAPTNLTASKLGGGVHLTWTDNSTDEEEFMIMRKSGTGAYEEVTSVTFNTTQYHLEPVTAGTAYTYQIWAMKDGAHSMSNEVPFTFTP